MSRIRDRQRTLVLLAVLACWALAGTGWAAAYPTGPEKFPELAGETAKLDAVEAIARHPASLRDAALQLSTEPELIVQVEGIRAWSSRGFEEILDGKDEAQRADLWEMIRYPELVASVVEGGEPGEVIGDIPAEAQETARRAAGHSPEALERIHALQQETDDAFADVLNHLEPSLADALESVASEPALLSVLAENLELTVELGDAYQRDPEDVRAWLGNLAERVAAEDEREREQWSEAIRDDDQLRDDVVEAASAWEQEQEGLARRAAYDDGYDHGYGRGWTDARSPEHRVRPYPYWYGYPVRAFDVFVPAAHAHALWTPHSHWGHLGFRVRHGRSLVVVSAPSLPFLYWLRARHPDHRYARSYGHHRRARQLWHATDHRVHHAHQYRAKRHAWGHRKHRRDRARDRHDKHPRIAKLRLDDSRDERRARRSDRTRRGDKRARKRRADDQRDPKAKHRTKKSRKRAHGRAADRRGGKDKKGRARSAKSRKKRSGGVEEPRTERRRDRVAKQKRRADRKNRGEARRTKKAARQEATAKKRARRAERSQSRKATDRKRSNAARSKSKAGNKAKARASRDRQRAKARRSAKASRPKAKPNRGARKKARAEGRAKKGKAERKRARKAKKGSRDRRGRRVARR